jgi:hypothetical protein
LLKNAIVPQLVNNSRPIFGTLRIFAVFIMACDCALSSHFTFIFYCKVIQPSTPRPRPCLLFSGFPPGSVFVFSAPHASNTLRPSFSCDSFGKSTHETPRYELFSIPMSIPHRLKHSSQYPACMAPSTRLNSISTLSIGVAGGEVQGGGRISAQPRDLDIIYYLCLVIY